MKKSDSHWSKVLPPDWGFLIACGLAILAVLGGILFVYQRNGGEFVDGLDERIGEIVAKRARLSATAGRTDEALKLFEESLSLPFMDEAQRLFCIQDFSTLLIDEGRYDDALARIEEGTLSNGQDGKLAYLRFRAHKEAGRTEDALTAAGQYYAVGEASSNAGTMRAAKFAEATVYRDTARPEEALDAFLAAHELSPGADTAVRAGRLCVLLGRTPRARELLEYAANTAAGADAKAAQELLSQLPN